MPELPEVATTIKYLEPAMRGHTVLDFTVTNKGESHFNLPISEVKKKLLNQTLEKINRHGKWMLFDFGAVRAVGHLRMSGRYKIDTEILNHPHNRFQLHLDGGNVVNYIDLRRFGTFHLVEDFQNYRSLKELGPDALDRKKLTVEYIQDRLRSVKKPIYSALLDQTVIAGLGNIYVNEILFASEIHPLLSANQVSKEQLESIQRNMWCILTKALELKGTTLIDNLYQDPEGKTGEFTKLLNVYGKKKDPNIEVIKIGGRSVFVNKKRQKSPD